MVFQEHSDEALVGEDMMENTSDEREPAIMVPIALVNDHHFWGVVDSKDGVLIAPVDKGECAAFRSPTCLGQCPDASGRVGGSAGLGVCPDSSGRHAKDASSGLEDGEKPHVAFQDMGGNR